MRPNKTEQSDTKKASRALSADYIKETLDVYHDEYIFLEEAQWKGEELTGSFRLEHYPFTKDHFIRYVTASMLMLYLSQIGYVYARTMCDVLQLTNQDSKRFDYFALRDSGNIVFFDFARILFRDKIYLSESPLVITMKLDRKTTIKGNQIGEISFHSSDNKITGKAKIAIIAGEMGNGL